MLTLPLLHPCRTIAGAPCGVRGPVSVTARGTGVPEGENLRHRRSAPEGRPLPMKGIISAYADWGRASGMPL